jgi:hypothetical protein
MPLGELLKQLSELGLSLRRKEGDAVEVVGDGARLSESLRQSLREHKTEILKVLPKPKHRPSWWDRRLSDADNQLLDDFLEYGPGGPQEPPIDFEDGLAPLIDILPCPKCGSLQAWWDSYGAQHCWRCDPPIKSIRNLLRASELRSEAQRRLRDDSVPMYGRQLLRQGRRRP